MTKLLRLSLWLLVTSEYLLGNAEAEPALRRQEQTWHEEFSGLPSREYRANHRELQRVATICADAPTDFATSLYINHVGDGTPFREKDLDTLLRLALVTFNQQTADTCDTTYRTLSSVSVSGVSYSPELDFIRLRYDFTGQCDGCIPTQRESGVGPLFGDSENRKGKQQRRTQEVPLAAPDSRLKQRIKGKINHDAVERREPKLDDEDRILMKNYICECHSEVGASKLRGPTASEFESALNQMITTARMQGVLSGVVSVNEMFEAGVAGHSTVLPTGAARDVTCVGQQDFATDIWVEFVRGAELTKAEEIPMEVALLETFNEMSLLACDVPFFRIVSDVSYVETRANGSDKLQMKFEVSGKCVNCDPESVNLFDANPLESQDPSVGVNVDNYRPPSGSLLMAEVGRVEIAESGPFVVVRNVPISCVCPLNEEGLPLRSPTAREFAAILQDTINTLRGGNRIISVQQVVRVAEGEIEGACSAEITTFESVFFADFSGRPELLQESEVFTLEGGFAQTYNELSFNSCDSLYRSISAVRLIPGISRRRALQPAGVGSASNSSDVPDLQSEAPSVYLVTGQCRGCQITSAGSFPLMDDAFRFRQLMVGDQEETMPCYTYSNAINKLQGLQTKDGDRVDILSRFLQEERRLEPCLCAPGVFPDSPMAPTPEAFRQAYNVKIEEYNTVGSVKNVQQVSQLVEVPPGLVTVQFDMFYGTLEGLGAQSDSDFEELEFETGRFFRTNLIDHYDTVPNVTLLAVTVARSNVTTVRPDLDKVQVPFAADLIFDEDSILPSPGDVTFVMATFDYVEYIIDYLWELRKPAAAANANEQAKVNAFGRTNRVRFAGRERRLVDFGMRLTVRSDRTNQTPDEEDRRGLEQQIDQFFLDYLTSLGLYVASFTAHVGEEDIRVTGDGLVLVNFAATMEFSTVTERPSPTEIQTIMKTADLNALLEQLLAASPTGTGFFNDPLGISFSD